MAADRIPLRIYPQDPGVLPLVEVDVKAENLLPGPIGPRIAVYEYNRDTDMVYAPAQPSRHGTFPKYGVEDHRFHQLNAYAIIARAVELVELELGRSLAWGFPGGRLLVVPHAGFMDNAFYENETHSLQFYSFQPEGSRAIYHTCLSHDIVTHETGHALLDSIRRRYLDANHPQTSALHEAIGDLTALFAALSHRSVRRRVFKQGLKRRNLVSTIAEKFERNEGIRELFGGPSAELRNSTDPHDLSMWLTRALYDALIDFVSIGRDAGDDRDRAMRVGRRALQRMVVRALDYLPPADATFADVARAMIAADTYAQPVDGRDYRKALVRQLKRHKVIDEEGLRDKGRGVGEVWKPLPRSWPRLDRMEAYQFLDANRRALALSTHALYRDFVLRDLFLTAPLPGVHAAEQVIMTYEYAVDVPLEGFEDAEWLPIWGGGTLVFDMRGELIHHAEKPVTRDRVGEALAFIDSEYGARIGPMRPGSDDRILQASSNRPWSLHTSGGYAVLRANPFARCYSRPIPAPRRAKR